MPTTSEQTYAGNNHIIGKNFHIHTCNPSFILKLGNRQWRTEWHYYFGPSVVLKNGEVAKNQPGERSPWWLIAAWWKDQGCRVVDGVGIWDYPEVEVIECAKTGRKVKFWKGYHNFGPVRVL